MASQPEKYLPEDILISVFYRVPVESLLRCRGVCRAWHQIISADSFVAAHLAYRKTCPNKYILYDGSLFCKLLPNFEAFFEGTCRKSKLYHPVRLFYRGKTFCGPKIHGMCNGLLCLSNRDYRMGDVIYLYNVSCKRIKKLPQLNFFPTKKDAGFTKNVPGLSFGYYDDDYKVVVIAPVGKTYTVYVYGLGTNSWKNIHPNFDVGYVMRTMDTKFVHNTVYAMTFSLVICIDLSNDTIQVVEFPVELFCQHKTMEACGETIAVFEYEKNHGQSVNMWILRDKSSSKPTWQNLFGFVFEEACDNVDVVGILDNGKYIIRTHNDAESLITFFLWDLDSQELTEFRSMNTARDRLYAIGRIHCNYVESLLLLNEDSVDPD